MGKIKLQSFEITFDDNHRIHKFGDTVNGKCTIALEGELPLSMIKMSLIGLAEVKWTEHRGTGNHRRTHTYHDEVKYLMLSHDFVGNTYNAMITKGIHVFPFSFQLPTEGIPSSFDGFHGQITYSVEAEIEKPLFSFNHRTKAEFNVEAPLFYDNLLQPIDGSNEKKLGLLWFKSGFIKMDVKIAKRGYSPGEIISINCNITNQTTVRVTPRATLKQTQVFMAKRKQRMREVKYLRSEGTPVDSGIVNSEIIQLPIPANTSLSIECPIIMVTYDVHVTAVIPNSINIHVDLPIVITTDEILNDVTKFQCTEKSMIYVNI